MNKLISFTLPRMISITPSHVLDPDIAIAASRAGSMAILDLGYSDPLGRVAPVLDRLASCSCPGAQWGIRWDTLGLASRGLDHLAELLHRPVPTIVLAGSDDVDLPALRKRTECRQVLVEAGDLQAAQAAIAAGSDGLIIKGHEAAGSVSRYSTFVLLQELKGHLSVPYWVQGGIGTHSAAAAMLAGAAGVVLCEQLWLAEESPLAHPDARGTWSQLDGSETVLLGPEETPFRLFARAGRNKFRELEQRVLRSEFGKSCCWNTWRRRMIRCCHWDRISPLLRRWPSATVQLAAS